MIDAKDDRLDLEVRINIMAVDYLHNQSKHIEGNELEYIAFKWGAKIMYQYLEEKYFLNDLLKTL